MIVVVVFAYTKKLRNLLKSEFGLDCEVIKMRWNCWDGKVKL